MTSAPPPPAGFKVQVVLPTSQEQAQDTVVEYLQRTLDALPPGTVLDATRYGVAGSNAPCTDDPAVARPPTEFSTNGDLKLPPGTEPNDVIDRIGHVWTSWGWYVIERDGFRKPNRFGYAPDGYALQVKASSRAGASPTVVGVSPCYPEDLQRDGVALPKVLRSN